MRRQIPSEKTKDILEFATKRPRDRLESIKTGLSVSFIDYKSDVINKS
jgi:eukaryotic translation initiation factor 2C